MKSKIEDGINAARMDGVIRLAEYKVPQLAEYIVQALADGERDLDARMEVLDRATPVVSMSTGDLVALVARNNRQMTADTEVMVADQMYMSEDWFTERHLAWGLQRLFGVWCYSSARPGGGGVHTNMRICGHRTQIVGFLTIVRSLLDAGRPWIRSVDDHEERSRFWRTIAHLIVSTEKAADEASKQFSRWNEAKQMCQRHWGEPNVVPTPTPAQNGDPLFQTATGVLAEVVI